MSVQRDDIVTHVALPVGGNEAFVKQIEDLLRRRLIAAGICTASLQDEAKEKKGNRFGRLGHFLGSSLLSGLRRVVCLLTCAAVSPAFAAFSSNPNHQGLGASPLRAGAR